MASQTVALKGTIILKRADVGSKSECDGCFLKTVHGQEIRLHHDGDNPFAEPTLKALVGRRCVVHGTFFNGKLIASRIEPK